MKSKTRLDSAVFQLTPTRTRYDLVIMANGKTEKIGSGLLNPFLAHLKTAQDQIAKGGYSIMLQPDSGSDATWFTKGTVERFVRFVSTPEVLERVNTVESEILQIEESIAIQSNDSLGLTTADVSQRRAKDYSKGSTESNEGSKPVFVADSDKAIVLYTPGVHQPESNGSTLKEENSKVQLLKVLETRKIVLQKEQAMAFARAVAAGFDMDHIDDLISFGESFGATRLMEACLRFVHLWKVKHETGQWLDIESAEAMSSRSDFSSMNAETKKQNDLKEAWPGSISELEFDGNTKAANNNSTDGRPPLDAQLPASNQEYFQGQLPHHPMYPQWPPGVPPVFHPYPMQALPYYQNYPTGPYFQPPYPTVEDPRFNSTQRMGLKRHSMDGKDYNTQSETSERGISRRRSKDVSESEEEGSEDGEWQRKANRSGKRKSGMVVIRNINYITSKKKNSSGNVSESASDPDSNDDSENSQSDSQEVKLKNIADSLKSGGNLSKSAGIGRPCVKDDTVHEKEADGGDWQAFQKFLLRDDNKEPHDVDQDFFSMEKEAQMVSRKNTTASDPIVPHGQHFGESHDGRMIEFDTISGKVSRTLKASTDELLTSGGGFGKEFRDCNVDGQVAKIEGGRGRYRRMSNDAFMIARGENQLSNVSSQSDPLAGNVYERGPNSLDRSSLHKVSDESFIVPLRSNSQDQGQTAIYMDTEIPSDLQKAEHSSERVKSQVGYEPDDLSLMPDRGLESNDYDLAMDYEMQLRYENVGSVQNRNQDNVVTGGTEKAKKLMKKSKTAQDSADKRKTVAAARKGKPSKFSPSNDAQARAEKLRAFKSDLQKIKKEKEEEDAKRLENLKRERQKRIAARGNSNPAKSPVSSQTRTRLPTKLSPSIHRGSRFSDTEPASSSPLQRLPIRTGSVGSNGSEKAIKPSKVNNAGKLSTNGLSRSASSLPDLKKERDGVTPEPKATAARIRRLSEPKTINSHHASSSKLRSTDTVSKSKSKVSNGPEIKKISAIITLDKTKAATLPELKIRASKGPSDIVEKKSEAKDSAVKANGSRSSVIPGITKVKGSNGGTSYDSSGHDNPVVEKSIVMLECENPRHPIQEPEENVEIRKGSYLEDKAEQNNELVAKYSPHPMGEIGQTHREHKLDKQSISHEVIVDNGREESTSATINLAAKQYQAPYARVSSLEDPSVTVDYVNAPPTSTKVAANIETAKVYLSDSRDTNSLEESSESLEKPRGKESSKGFRRLLKFGKKNHSSSAVERGVESDKLSTSSSHNDDHAPTSSSLEVHTLKNLISQDENPTAATPPKVSRPFSLLSPFRSKTSEKKLAT